ncbi:metal-dependent hydrolase [Thalassobellus sediminis]|uniref:metal-dependent hydrolase n=1 Tax=Thalassobellus sediminis TaxID=3367753 RepID=UPI0037903667
MGLLFFWSLFTHPILDCFTPYGTQLFAPFSNYRVAFNNIAVADPLYTLPFLICMIVLMFFKRTTVKRQLWLKFGIGISSIYMIFTLGNKLYIDSVFIKSLKDSDVNAIRFTTQPAILNNILWYGIAETDTSYFVANYSLFDTKNRFLNFKAIPKKRDLKPSKFNDIKNLAWFSNQYYSVYKIGDNQYQYNDLRYPILDENTPNTSVFSLLLYKDENRLNMKPFEPKFDSLGAIMASMWLRIKGN